MQSRRHARRLKDRPHVLCSIIKHSLLALRLKQGIIYAGRNCWWNKLENGLGNNIGNRHRHIRGESEQPDIENRESMTE